MTSSNLIGKKLTCWHNGREVTGGMALWKNNTLSKLIKVRIKPDNGKRAFWLKDRFMEDV